MPVMETQRRYNPLTRQWVLVCAGRSQRPWQGAKEVDQPVAQQSYDQGCYLCPGNERINGALNPTYHDTFIFTNDFSSLTPRPQESHQPILDDPLFKATPTKGTCRVLCFSPRHDLSLPQLSVAQIQKVIDAWQQEFIDLSQQYAWVQLFENKGAAMGCSNPHPHGQIWASNFLPNELQTEEQNQQAYYQQHNRSMLFDYTQDELVKQERIVAENADWLVVVPYWATWPFETLLLPKTILASWHDITVAQKTTLADILRSFLQCYDRLFNTSFPYSMGWHCAPNGAAEKKAWQLHAHFYPPLLRSATIKKFMVGYEMLAEAQRDITPEVAAKKLREA